jgi:dihydroorotase-like cyclic amidohydrolase
MDLVLANGRLVTPSGVVAGAIGIEDGRIVAIAAQPPPADQTIDLGGLYAVS